jgi:hypothetical protein
MKRHIKIVKCQNEEGKDVIYNNGISVGNNRNNEETEGKEYSLLREGTDEIEYSELDELFKKVETKLK